MRALPLLLLVFSLTGCSLLHTKPAHKPESPATTSQPAPPTKPKSTSHPAPAILYTSAEELVGKPFRDMGQVSGAICQTGMQDATPTIANAKKRMQSRATAMKANAVLLHQCEILSSVDGCYRQAICQGTALKVSAQ
ncbi:Rcs stress response system protein RcsF [Affinibrenneria salicis]|uniref:Outer membrane lipoprotein RcsF n=1 Tax=Affinibrenneria salicis TaxID=2590031 RepID=A0A5J5FV01_9GAMM|nr:Rcs stress response system protein RcsF [Affinibrenneria salicis]KAA8997594.1 Rcs stress response system protein RcsF [Affinibrenneria salicis]